MHNSNCKDCFRVRVQNHLIPKLMAQRGLQRKRQRHCCMGAQCWRANAPVHRPT